MAKKLSCVSYGSLKRFPHTFTTVREYMLDDFKHPVTEVFCHLLVLDAVCVANILLDTCPVGKPVFNLTFGHFYGIIFVKRS